LDEKENSVQNFDGDISEMEITWEDDVYTDLWETGCKGEN
jgi:hypothetical protein